MGHQMQIFILEHLVIVENLEENDEKLVFHNVKYLHISYERTSLQH